MSEHLPEASGGETDFAAMFTEAHTEGSESSTTGLPPTTVAPLETPAPARDVNRDELGRFAPKPGDDPLQGMKEQQEQSTEEQAETFTQVDPSTLSPELQAIYKSLQADYTRKTQEVAAQRRQFDFLENTDPDIIREAIDLHSTLQDPSAWQALHAEIEAGLRSMGLTPGEAAVEATRQMQEASPTQIDPTSYADDEELAPLATAYSKLEAELAQIKQSIAAREEAEQAQRYQMALVGEWQRQQNAILQANPVYTQADMDYITELASFHDGNLLSAQQRYEQMKADVLTRYIGQKESVSPETQTPSGGGTLTVEGPEVIDLDDARRLSLEFEEMARANSA